MFSGFLKASLVAMFLLATNVPDATATTPLLSQGLLTDQNDVPVSGNVYVYTFDMGKITNVESLQTTSGNFSLRASPTAAMKEASAKNNGYVHFMAIGITDNSSQATFFSRQYSGTAWSSSPEKVNIKADKPFTAEQKTGLSKATASAPLGAIEDDCLSTGGYQPVNATTAYTMVGELHNGDGMTSTYTYGNGNTADTEMSVKVSVDGQNWSAGGTNHIGTTNTAEVSRTRSTIYGYGIKTSFTYVKFQKKAFWGGLSCLFAPNYLEMAWAWNSGLLTGWDVRYLDGQCGTTYRATSVWFEQGDTFSRDRNDLTWYDAGLKVFGAGVLTKSGASNYVKLKMSFGSKHAYYRICGNNDSPVRALRIFV